MGHIQEMGVGMCWGNKSIPIDSCLEEKIFSFDLQSLGLEGGLSELYA